MKYVFLYSVIDLFFNLNDEVFDLITGKYRIVLSESKLYKMTIYEYKRYICLENLKKDFVVLLLQAYCEIFESESFLDIQNLDKNLNRNFIFDLKTQIDYIIENSGKVPNRPFLENLFIKCIIYLHYNIKCRHNCEIPNMSYKNIFNQMINRNRSF
ncbi:hypothetical protein CWI37_0348p0020 [Hamiltosporidium tvaerminnensis]|uniref:Uncharacterized protein n=1 Tax=Hamiltosporidium tvaerminnensis TaxID=1176355 RepID=A0A4V2JV88_9MICR|nr:hypothetical protein CWI37_0348p0020 [Hamiltosporidium tvaerminnensis]